MSDELSEVEVEERLEELEIWGFEAGRLVTEVEFDSYRDAVFFANAVFSIAEELGHHPEVRVEYGAVSVDVYSHDSEQLTKRDFETAERIEGVLGDISWE